MGNVTTVERRDAESLNAKKKKENEKAKQGCG